MKLVFATGNSGKLAEARQILGPSFNVLSPRDFGILEEPEENGLTFKENSFIKARYIYERTGLDCFADDSGLCVDCLDGKPGIYSARYADMPGVTHSFDDNIDKVLDEMFLALGTGKTAFDSLSQEARAAHFTCVATLFLGGKAYFFDGYLYGSLISERRGTNGFGYDPVFVPRGYRETLSEMGDVLKNSLSHRGEALRKMAEFLKKT